MNGLGYTEFATDNQAYSWVISYYAFGKLSATNYRMVYYSRIISWSTL